MTPTNTPYASASARCRGGRAAWACARWRSVCNDISSSRVDGEGRGDHVAVGEPELAPEPVGAGGLEPGVESEVGTEGAAGGGEGRAAVSVGGLGVGVGEPGAVGAQDHDVAGRAEVGLQSG